MSNKLYVGNLPYSISNEELSEVFSDAGEVVSANVIMDRETNRSKGFGFVELSDADAAQKAIEELNGKEVGGRALKVSLAKPREDRPRRF